MPELSFQIEGMQPIPYAAMPLLGLKIRIQAGNADAQIQNVILQCQIQIEPSRRRYQAAEQEKLRDLFGEPSRWSQTLRPMLWTNASVVVAPFHGETVAEVPVPCTFDFTVATTKYFHGLEKGEIPICVLFSGTVFHATPAGDWQVAKIPWDREANYRVPVSVWKDLMDQHYPNTAWLCVRRDVFEGLHEFKVSRGIPTWEAAFESLLASAEENDLRKMEKVQAGL
jgi:hypothetical protein